jgi:hypothetical protein
MWMSPPVFAAATIQLDGTVTVWTTMLLRALRTLAVKMISQLPRSLRRLIPAVVSLTVLFAPRVLFAQGCALCYTQAAGSTQRFIQALRSGIIILMVPPMFLSLMFTVLAYRRRNASYDELVPEDGPIDEEML